MAGGEDEQGGVTSYILQISIRRFKKATQPSAHHFAAHVSFNVVVRLNTSRPA